MENEKRLIDANELLRDAEDYGPIKGGLADMYDVKWLVDAQITVDAVEVVRCEECVHYEAPDEGDFLGRCLSGKVAVSHGGEIYPERGFFCPYGERREPHENL